MKAILRRWLLALIGSDIDAAVDRAVDVFLQERCVLGVTTHGTPSASARARASTASKGAAAAHIGECTGSEASSDWEYHDSGDRTFEDTLRRVRARAPGEPDPAWLKDLGAAVQRYRRKKAEYQKAWYARKKRNEANRAIEGQERAFDVFLQERCVLGADAWLKSSELYRAYRLFCSENRLLGVGRVLFVKLMEARCYERSRSRRTIAGVQMRTYEGICLKAGGGEAQFTGCDSVKRTALP